jgi:hypothetical protein
MKKLPKKLYVPQVGVWNGPVKLKDEDGNLRLLTAEEIQVVSYYWRLRVKC